jgi:hypothetical protein
MSEKQKSVLVICSSPNPNSDYSAKDNQDMLNKLLGSPEKRTVEFLSGEEGQRFPENMPQGKKYDLILFAGCNPHLFFTSVLFDYKTATKLLYDRLKEKGVVVIVESEKNIRERIQPATYYDEHKTTVTVDKLIEMYSGQSTAPGTKSLPEDSIKHYIPMFKAKLKYWDHKFKKQQTKKEEGKTQQYFVYKKQPASADKNIEKEVDTTIEKAQAAMTAEKEKGDGRGTASQAVCEKILEEIEKILSKKGTPTAVMTEIQGVLTTANIKVTIARKGTAKKSTTTGNINSLQGEEASKEKLRAIKTALQDSARSADERLRDIREKVAPAARPNKTAKVSGNSSSTSNSFNWSKWNESNSNSNSAKTPESEQEIREFDFQELEMDEPGDDAHLDLLNDFIGRQLNTEYTAEVEGNPLIKNGYPGKIKPKAEPQFECGEPPAAEGGAAPQPQLPLVKLECLNADGTNSDCVIHSLLLATCPNFRKAKIEGGEKEIINKEGKKRMEYEQFATEFRTEFLPELVDTIIEKELTERRKQLIDGENLNEEEKKLSEEDRAERYEEFEKVKAALREKSHAELQSPNEFLPDELIEMICKFYNIRILVFGPAPPEGGVRVARILNSGGNPERTFVVSNSSQVHWEPVRTVGENRYTLRPEEVECFSKKYAVDSTVDTQLEIAFAEMDNVLNMQKKGATKPALEQYLQAKQAEANAENAAVQAAEANGRRLKREKSAPGPVTRAYVAEEPRILYLMDIIKKLTTKMKTFWNFDNPTERKINKKYEKFIVSLRSMAKDAASGAGQELEALKALPEVVEAETFSGLEPDAVRKEFTAPKRKTAKKATGKKKGGRRTRRKRFA